MDFEYTNRPGQPPRKRPHPDPDASADGSMMEWEPETPKEREKRLFPAGAGSVFLFKPPDGLDVAAPPSPSPSPTWPSEAGELDPKALGVDRRHERDDLALVPISANGLKHEQEARRRRAAKRTGVSPQRRSKGKEPAAVEDLTTDEDEPAAKLDRRGDMHHHLSLYGWQPGAPPPSTPTLLLSYLDLFFRSSVVVLSLYFALLFVWAFAHDISDKLTHYSTEIRQDIVHCSTQYTLNRCDPPSARTPLTAASCEAWEHCLNRDPLSSVGRLRVAAEAGGEVVTGFVDALSWKTSGFMLVLAIGGLYALRPSFRSAFPSPSHPASSSSSSHQPSPYPHLAYHPHPQNGYSLPVPQEWRPGMPLSFGPGTDRREADGTRSWFSR